MLISWEHGNIHDIVGKLPGKKRGAPDEFPGRFDLVWVFDRDGPDWRFTPVPQFLLPGDRPVEQGGHGAPA